MQTQPPDQPQDQNAETAETAETTVDETSADPVDQEASGADETPADVEKPVDENQEAADEEGEKPAETPPAKHKRDSGFTRRLARLERQLAEKDQMLAQVLSRMPQVTPNGTPPANPDPAAKAVEQFNDLVNQGVQRAMAAEKTASAARELAQEWEKQLPEDDDESHEIRTMISQVGSLRPGAVKEVLLTSKLLPKIMKELYRNPLELARINALPEARAAAEIGRLEERLSSGATPSRPGSAARPPPPPSKVNGAAATSTRRLEDLPLKEYKAAMRSGRR